MPKNRSQELYLALRRVIRLLRKLPIWAFFLSTQSALHYIVTSSEKDVSNKNAYTKIAPFFSFPFDMDLDRKLSEDLNGELERSLAGFSTVDHMTSMGRPLWNAFKQDDYEDIVAFVQRKLLNSITFDTTDRNQVLALLSNRICLEPCLTNKETTDLLTEGVNFHLHVILQMDPDNGLFRTTVSSEPIVAEVAAALLNDNLPTGGTKSKIWANAIKTLKDKLLAPGYIDKGRSGEMVSRLLMIVARDSLLSEKREKIFPFSQPFLLTAFLQKLLISNLATEVLASTPKPKARLWETLEMIFGNARLNFSHFVSTSKALEPTSVPDLIHGLLQHQAALQLHDNQEIRDLLIPLYLGNPQTPFDRNSLGVLLVQVNDRKQEASRELADKVYNKLFPNMPILSLIVELGSKESRVQILQGSGPKHCSIKISGCGSNSTLASMKNL